MRASVSEQRGEGNQSGPGLVFCVFIGKRAGQNRRAEVKFAAFGGAPPRAGGTRVYPCNMPKKRGLTVDRAI